MNNTKTNKIKTNKKLVQVLFPPNFVLCRAIFFSHWFQSKKLLCMELVPSNSEKMTFHPGKNLLVIPVSRQHLLEHARFFAIVHL